ncbi:MAG: Ku protein [Candidatus Hydrogenedentes bacterium]|nr:Ku protein [Candidatus Hydrogenedentota bacterium]
MARPTWKGNISFGLVNIGVELYPMEKRKELSFRLLDSRNNARIRYEKVNDVTGEEVPWDQIVKGYEFDDGNFVLLTEKDFERVAVEATKTVEIEDFVDADQIPYAYFDKPYVLVPSKNGQKPYVVLREALKKSGKVGIAKVVIRTRQYLAAVFSQGEALYLCVLRFADELKKLKEFDLPDEDLGAYKVSQKEIDMAIQLVDTMSAPWKPEQYHDEYSEALMKWIEKKAAAHGQVSLPELPEEEEEPAATNIVNIMDLLKKSMQETEKRKPSTSPARKSGNGSNSKSKPKTKASARKRAS